MSSSKDSMMEAARQQALASAELIYDTRKCRQKFFDHDIFGEPAWDMLLDLYIHHLKGRQSKITGLTQANDIAIATGVRWLSVLQNQGLVSRQRSGDDSRISWVQLTPEGVSRMSRFIETVGPLMAARPA